MHIIDRAADAGAGPVPRNLSVVVYCASISLQALDWCVCKT